jgi:peptide/nickel transport system substrate-binding protein
MIKSRLRRTLGISLALAVAAPLGFADPVSAARGDREDVGGSGNDVNPQPARNIKQGGTLRYVQVTLCPQFNTNAAGGNALDCSTPLGPLLPSYIYFDGNGALRINKDYASDIKVSRVNGKQTVTYTLNPKAKWSDGKTVGLADFVGMWKAHTDTAFAVVSRVGYEKIESIARGKSANEVVVTYKETYPDWQPLFGLLKPASLTADPTTFANAWKNGPTVTAGPFVWDSIDPVGRTVTIKRNNAWWGDRPYLDRIVFKHLPQTAQADALLNGEIDNMDVSIDINAVARARADKGRKVKLAFSKAPIHEHLTFGPPTAVTGDLAVRQAIMMSIDRQRIATAIQGPVIGRKNAKPNNNHFFLDGLYCNQDNTGTLGKQNLQQARQLLDRAGWTVGSDGIRSKGGVRLSVALKYPSGNDARRDAVLLSAAMAKEAGIELVPTLVPSAEYFVSHVTQPPNFELAIFAWVGGSFPISSASNIYKQNTAQNFSNIGSAQIDTLLNRANSVLNLSQRCKLTNDADKEIYRLVHSITLYQRPAAIAYNKNLANFGAFGYTSIDWTKVGFVR